MNQGPYPIQGHYQDAYPVQMPYQYQPGHQGLIAPDPNHYPPLPKTISNTDEAGRKYELLVVQQPRRARMCGFGDKDRRPITPPPCVRLIITDTRTGKEVDCNDIDHQMFVLNVDLWQPDGSGEVNLVRHTTHSPSISTSVHLTYAEIKPLYAPVQALEHPSFKNEPAQGYQDSPYNPYPLTGPPQVASYVRGPDGQEKAVAYIHGFHDGQPLSDHHHQGYGQSLTGAQIHAQGRGGPPQYDFQAQQAPPPQGRQSHGQQPQGMFTRNLIGSISASAFRLTDTEDRIGIWFVLQDLSIRTEGMFRLRFSFVNVGAPSNNRKLPSPLTPGATSGGPLPANPLGTPAINTGKAPILAQCFSDVFNVYSAKKFPGVVESTPLSKCFATQGIKIPIRKEGGGPDNKKRGAGEMFDDDD